jgi:hypothetical protein
MVSRTVEGEVRDIRGDLIQPGDLLLDDGGRLYVAQFTTLPFTRQTLVTTLKARLSRGRIVTEDTNFHIHGKFTARVDIEEVRDKTNPELRRLYRKYMTSGGQDG